MDILKAILGLLPPPERILPAPHIPDFISLFRRVADDDEAVVLYYNGFENLGVITTEGKLTNRWNDCTYVENPLTKPEETELAEFVREFTFDKQLLKPGRKEHE